MPIYEYKCEECDHVFEDMVLSSKDTGPDKCPKCGAAQVSRLISGTNFQLKGGGWFHSDYGKKGSPAASDSTASASDKSETKKSGDESVSTSDVKETTPAPAEKASSAPQTTTSEPSA